MSRSFPITGSVCGGEDAKAAVIAKPWHFFPLAVLLMAAGMAFTTSAVAAPGTPGVPQSPTAIYTENFQNRPGPNPIIKLNAYTGTTGQTYGAHANWLRDCNGWIASANQSTAGATQISDCNGSQVSWNTAQQLAWALGVYAGQSQAAARDNYAVSAYTAANPGAGLVEFQTATNIALSANNRFVSFSVDVAANGCQASAPALQFSLVNDANIAVPLGSPINGCMGSPVSVPAVGVSGATTAVAGTYTSNGAVLFSGSSVGVRMVNNNGSGAGNDHAFDNIRILDTTPQLDKSFSPASVSVGGTSTLTFTVTNTSDLAAKNGWSFTDTLPAGLVIADVPATGTTCPSGNVTASAGTNAISATGNLSAGMSSCTITVDVASATAGTFQNCASNVSPSAGLNPPGCAAVSFIGQADLFITKTDNNVTYAPDTNLVYTIVAGNNGPSSVPNAQVSDPLPAGISAATWTCGGAIGGGICGAASGSGAIESTANLPVGASVTYTLTLSVPSTATGNLTNTATVTAPTGITDPDLSNNSADDTNVFSLATVAKSALSPASGTSVEAGQTIAYQLTLEVIGGPLARQAQTTDQLGAGLTFGALGTISDPARLSCSGASPLICTLAAGTPAGSYTVEYTATVDAAAAGRVTNTVSGLPCATTNGCTTTHEVSSVMAQKSANPASGVAVEIGDTIAYTLTFTVTGGALAESKTATDTLGAGLAFAAMGAVSNPGLLSCSGRVPMICTLAQGAPAGSYTVEFTATVTAAAADAVVNTLNGIACATADGCATRHPLSMVTVRKSADPAAGTRVVPGETIKYTLAFAVSGGTTTQARVATDQLGAGLSFGALGAISHPDLLGCSDGTPMRCTLAAGAPIGTYAVSYTATVDAAAIGTVVNTVTGVPCAPDGSCTTEHPLRAAIDVVKSAVPTAGTEVRIGDAIEYTLTATVSRGTTGEAVPLIDTPDVGVDIVALPANCAAAGGNIVCTLDAGTAPGTYAFVYTVIVNDSVLESLGNVVVSGYRGSSVDVTCVSCDTAHPVLKVPSLRLIKTTGVREARVGDLVRYTLTVENVGNVDARDISVIDTPPAGFSYVDGSLSVIDRDNAAIANGYSPIRFEGLDIAIGRSATLAYLMRVGAGVRRGVQINRAQAFGLDDTPVSNIATAELAVIADPLLDDSLIFGTVFHDRNGDGWQDHEEPGIPGVRIASVDGVLIETDPFGRYHLTGVLGGTERGRNFILKVDPSTLPAGTEFTTDNPLLRRITPGVPVRFDWGVKLLEQVIEGGTRHTDLELGEVIFQPGSAELRSEYLPTIEKMAAKVREYGGGEVVIQANGQTERFALARAEAVRDALLPLLDAATAKAVTVSVRGIVDDPGSLWVGVDGDGVTLGTVLFDTDKSAIRPEFKPLLEQVANRLERMGGGSIAIIGHTDIRASHAYNTALGMRRAKAVYEALTQRLSPEVRSKVRVEAIDDPKAAVEYGVH